MCIDAGDEQSGEPAMSWRGWKAIKAGWRQLAPPDGTAEVDAAIPVEQTILPTARATMRA
jgi:hypothetical protein